MENICKILNAMTVMNPVVLAKIPLFASHAL